MLSAFLHHDTLFAEMVEPLLSHVWSQAEVDANVVFQFHISCCLMVRCFLYSLSSISAIEYTSSISVNLHPVSEAKIVIIIIIIHFFSIYLFIPYLIYNSIGWGLLIIPNRLRSKLYFFYSFKFLIPAHIIRTPISAITCRLIIAKSCFNRCKILIALFYPVFHILCCTFIE